MIRNGVQQRGMNYGVIDQKGDRSDLSKKTRRTAEMGSWVHASVLQARLNICEQRSLTNY
jgi:hypothetical protein